MSHFFIAVFFDTPVPLGLIFEKLNKKIAKFCCKNLLILSKKNSAPAQVNFFDTPLYTLVIFENPNLIFVKIRVRFRADFTKCSQNVRFLGVAWVYPGNSFV